MKKKVPTYTLDRFIQDHAQIVNKVVRILIFKSLDLPLCRSTIDGSLKHGSFNLSLLLLDDDEIGLFSVEAIGESI